MDGGSPSTHRSLSVAAQLSYMGGSTTEVVKPVKP
jgi:hypothetical protein